MITDSGDVIFHVKFSALTFKPIDQEVLDGTVSQI
jgi:DNA-directed RNA polymerase subunit E'/Rpb7